MTYLLAVGVVALVTLSGSLVWVARALSHTSEVPGPAAERFDPAPLLSEIAKLDDRIDNLVVAVDEGIKGYKRAENRVQKTVTSARRLVRESGLEHAGIEAEYEEIQAEEITEAPQEERPQAEQLLRLDGPSGIPGLTANELEALKERANV